MPTLSPTIRLFVSSTFSDLKAERGALQREVFPRLKQLCLSKGLRFQAIDLRRGISEEAARDNKTMRICLRELKRCQQDRPKPNWVEEAKIRSGPVFKPQENQQTYQP